MHLSTVKALIPSLANATEIRQVTKGFSFDFKYFLYEQSGEPKYVLRTAPMNQSRQKREEYEAIADVYGLGVKTSKPIEFGLIESLGVCYMVLGYLEGEEAAEVLPSLTEDEQYRIGVKAGQDLRVMHQLKAPDMESWYTRRVSKHHRHHGNYLNCGVKLPEEDFVTSFINLNLIYMKERPNRFQHDDFHPSNLIVQNGSYAGTIDFNRFDWGDPYHDFLKIAYFSREVSIPFSIGQIHGYFNGMVPSAFWNLYTLYTAMTIFGTITWTLQVVPEQLDSMMARIRVVLEDHKNFESVIPSWYKP